MGPLTNHLFDAMIPRFALHWDFQDLVDAIGGRRVLWTDPTNWMGHVTNAGPNFRYRYVIGDIADLAEAQDEEYMREFLR